MSDSATLTDPRPLAARLVKSALDRLAAFILLIFASPVLLLSALAVRLAMGAPVMFTQRRPGQFGRPFLVRKFRTMREGSESDEERLTSVGRVIRAWSIDELPQLLNVLCGEMSFAGPRPLLEKYWPLYSPEQRRRHCVPPGITGWAQIHGRNAQTWDERFALDLWYVDHWGLALDARILIKTIARVLLRQGISAPGSATMPEFKG